MSHVSGSKTDGNSGKALKTYQAWSHHKIASKYQPGVIVTNTHGSLCLAGEDSIIDYDTMSPRREQILALWHRLGVIPFDDHL